MIVQLTSSLSSYGPENTNTIYDSQGTRTLVGTDYGDLETGVDSQVVFYYFRHDGTEPIYSAGIYLKAVGTNWGGYVESADTASIPYNPNYFKNGGLDTNSNPTTSTLDYELLRTSAVNNPEMGVRIHQDRNNSTIKSSGLGYNNIGLSFSPLSLSSTSLDYTKTTDPQSDGIIYPEPLDSSKLAQAGDEAKIGISLKLPTEVEGSGNIQFGVAIKYRYTQ